MENKRDRHTGWQENQSYILLEALTLAQQAFYEQAASWMPDAISTS